MNFLAHAYLSFNEPQILLGNLISDFVKGKKKFDYPRGVQKGITLHRSIDAFTDEHEATRIARNIFRPAYRLYGGAFVDVLYDHFLATDENEFTETTLFEFSQQVYTLIDHQIEWLPGEFFLMFPYMKSQNWLFNYRTREGTARSLEGVVRRAAYLTESKTARQLFEDHYQLLQQCYRQLWVDIKPYALGQYQWLLGNDS
jgi:acyl carrier protein phosphodiesterase